MAKPDPAYSGGDPYVFVSYSHADEDFVHAEIRWLQELGINVWYDTTGIGPGEEWTDEIARAIKGASHFLFFITPNSAASEHCRRELNFAQSQNVRVVAVHLAKTDLPDGLRLSLDNRQAVFRFRLDASAYRSALLVSLSSPGLAPAETKLVRPKSGLGRWFYPGTIAALLVFAGGWIVLRDIAPMSDPVEEVASVAKGPRLAVSPFLDLTADGVLSPFAAVASTAVHEQIAGYVRHRDAELLPLQAARHQADFVLEGTVRQVGNSVRITVQLIDQLTEQEIWTESFEQLSDEVFEDGGYVGRMTPTIANYFFFGRDLPAFIPRASYEAFRTGMIEFEAFALGGDASMMVAKDYVEQAAKLGGAKAGDLPMAQLALFYANRVGLGVSFEESRKQAHHYICAATAVQPWPFQLGAVQKNAFLDYDAAIESFKSANVPQDQVGQIYSEIGGIFRRQGRFNEAVAQLETALAHGAQLNEQGIYMTLGGIFRVLGKNQSALENLTLAKESGGSNTPYLDPLLAEVVFRLGRHDEALNILESAWVRDGEKYPEFFPAAFATLGQTEQAVRILTDLQSLPRDQYFGTYSSIVEAAHHVGNIEASLRWLDRAIDNGDAILFGNLRSSSYLPQLRSHPGFQAKMQRIIELESAGMPPCP